MELNIDSTTCTVCPWESSKCCHITYLLSCRIYLLHLNFDSVCHGLQEKRFLQLKNPWSHLRWKGRYSERDEKNWTPDLLKYLKFDPNTAQKFDNGKGMPFNTEMKRA